MIKIDKALPEQRLILTLKELTTIDSPEYSMELTLDATGDVFQFPLPASTSNSPERYDMFKVETEVFNEMPEGMYTYTVTQNDGKQVEAGKLKIIGIPEQVEIITPKPNHNYRTY
jgi:hypothetical protein